MNKTGPIIIIEDDADDQWLMKDAFRKLNYPNEVVFFWNGELALSYLDSITVNPFLILCDINMPVLNGFQLKDRIDKSAVLHLKCIPYLFFTTGSARDLIVKAYAQSAQGFFIKPTDYTELEDTLRAIVEYWQKCEAPEF